MEGTIRLSNRWGVHRHSVSLWDGHTRRGNKQIAHRLAALQAGADQEYGSLWLAEVMRDTTLMVKAVEAAGYSGRSAMLWRNSPRHEDHVKLADLIAHYLAVYGDDNLPD